MFIRGNSPLQQRRRLLIMMLQKAAQRRKQPPSGSGAGGQGGGANLKAIMDGIASIAKALGGGKAAGGGGASGGGRAGGGGGWGSRSGSPVGGQSNGSVNGGGEKPPLSGAEKALHGNNSLIRPIETDTSGKPTEDKTRPPATEKAPVSLPPSGRCGPSGWRAPGLSPVGGFGGFNLSQIKPTGTDTSVGQSEKNSQEQAQVASAGQNPAETSLAESAPLTPSEPNNTLNSFDLADSNLSGDGGQLASLESGGGESLAGGGEIAADMAPEPAPEPVSVA